MEHLFENHDLEFMYDVLDTIKEQAMAAAGSVKPEDRFVYLQHVMRDIRTVQRTLVDIDRSPEARMDIERLE